MNGKCWLLKSRPAVGTILLIALLFTACCPDPIVRQPTPTPTAAVLAGKPSRPSATVTFQPPPAPTAEPLPSPAATAEDSMTLREAIDEGVAEVQILGTGAASGNSIIIAVRRLGDRLATIRVEPGIVLASSNPAEQDMVVRRLLGWRVDEQQYRPAEAISLFGPEDAAQEYAVEAYCLNFQRNSPGQATSFSVGGPPPQGVLAVLQAVDQVPGAGTDVAALQMAVWAVTDNPTGAEMAERGYQSSVDLVQQILETAGLNPGDYRLFGGSAPPPGQTEEAPAPTAPPAMAVQAQVSTILDVGGQEVLWSPDGTQLLVSLREIHFYDAQGWKPVRSIDIQDWINGMLLSPDGTTLAVLAGTKDIKLYDVATGGEIVTLARTRASTSAASSGFMAFMPDGQALAVVVGDTIKLFDAVSGQEKSTLVAPGTHSIAISPDGGTLFAASWEGILALDPGSGEELLRFGEASRSCSRMALSPDGSLLAAGSAFDGSISLWDAAAGRQVRTLRGHSDGVSALAFSLDGRMLASAARDVTVKLWDVASGALLATLIGHTDEVNSLAFAPDGKLLATAALLETTRLWQLTSGVLDATPTAAPTAPGPVPTRLSLSAQAISPQNADQVKTVGRIEPGGTHLAWSPDGQTVAVGSDKLSFYDPSTWSLRHAVDADRWVKGLAFAPDGKALAAIVEMPGVVLYDPATAAELHTLPRSQINITPISSDYCAFTPDGKAVAVILGDTVKLFDVASGSETGTLVAPGARSIVFAAGGQTLFAASWEGVSQIDLATGEAVREFGDTSRSISHIALSPDGALLASGGMFAAPIVIYETATGRQFRSLAGHDDGVSALAFSPGGEVLASASSDVTIRLWDVAQGAELAVLVGHTTAPRSLAFSPDGAFLVSADDDRSVLIWAIKP
ncbi:MAG: WD40 repeat domain-containing protein, partial [Anaerolineaceae bacterium]|nr:WD40 repeat domain-containing protein [Anaerolineaceae bacterium]